jgi:hypothetical protein
MQNDIEALIKEHRDLLKQYKDQIESMSAQLKNEVAPKGKIKDFLMKCEQLKKKNPQLFHQVKEGVDKRMFAVEANRRLQEQKPLNRKGVNQRRWV